MRSVVTLLAVAAGLAVLPSSASAGAANITLSGVVTAKTRLGATLRCTVPDDSACRTRVVVTLRERVEDLPAGAVVGDRTTLVESGENRVVFVQLDKDLPQSTPKSSFRVTVTAKHGLRRLVSITRRGASATRVGLANSNPRWDTQPGSSTITVQTPYGDGCGANVTLRGLQQGSGSVEVDLVTERRDVPGQVCGQAFRNACVQIKLDAPLGDRGVWWRVFGVLQSPAQRSSNDLRIGGDAWDECPLVAVGETVVA